jgi:hypothetical protein
MATRSRFLPDRNQLSKPKARFEGWLLDQGYESCSISYPAATSASALVDEYLQDYPEREGERRRIEAHAEEIGWISDYDEDEELDVEDVDS